MVEDFNNVETKEDQIQYEDWMDGVNGYAEVSS